jgi:hypothetical protein
MGQAISFSFYSNSSDGNEIVAGALVILLDRLRPEAEVDTEAAEAAAMTVPIGVIP